MSKKNLTLSRLEANYLKTYSQIIGVDEVGRGAIAGPLTLCGFRLGLQQQIHTGVNDSKILTRKQRENLFPILIRHSYHIYHAHPKDIDKNGLTYEFKKGVLEIQEKLGDDQTITVVDGNISFKDKVGIVSIINADALLYSVAAASIIAKVTRDQIMYKFALRYPGYGFDTHVGYATKKHKAAIARMGPISIHRESCKDIKMYLNKNQ